MKTKLCLAMLLLAAAFARAQTNNLTALLQQGLFEEQANRNLDAAISDYQSLAAKFDRDRKLAATAIFRLGECYRMQGKTNEAAAQYQRILREFPDEKNLATLSRQNLTALGTAPSTATPSDNSAAKLWNRVKNLPPDQLERVLPTLAPDPVLTSLLQQRNEAETKLAELQNYNGPQSPDILAQKAALAAIHKQISKKINGIMAALKLRAELAQTTVQNTTSPNPEDKEIQRIRQMVQNSPDLINSSGNEGTPLQKAAWHGWLRVATFLLNHGADVNAQNTRPSSASHLCSTALGDATLTGNRAMVGLLLQHGADINTQCAGLRTPLEIAAENGFQAVLEVLLANKADVNAAPWGGTALLLSAQKGRTKIAQMLLAAGANPNLKNNDGDTPLSVAVQPSMVPQETRVEIVKLLLGADANPNVTNNDGRTPLSYTANGNWDKRPEIVKLLLTAKANPNGGTLDAPLLCAIHSRDVESAKLLLQAGAKPNSKGEVGWQNHSWSFSGRRGWATPLWLAIDMKQSPMVKLLLKFKANPDDTQIGGRYLLFDTLSTTNILKALLDAGAKVDVTETNGVHWTPLVDAAYHNNAAAVQMLLQHGANPNMMIKGGYTPLHSAAAALAGEKVFKLLLNAKANPNVRNDSGQTPLDLIKQQLKEGGMRTGFASRTAEEEHAKKLITLLHQHGALDHLPHWNDIEVSSPAWGRVSVFRKDTNDWNRFTLLETIYHVTGLRNLSFPNLSRVVILRPSHDSTNVTRLTVNLLNSTNGIDCSRDVPLKFGDVVEIPEREHTLAEKDRWTATQIQKIRRYLQDHAGEAKLIVAGGQTVQLPLKDFEPRNCYIGAVLKSSLARNVLTSDSDLSRVKVTRRDPKTGKKREWVLNCTGQQPWDQSSESPFQRRLQAIIHPHHASQETRNQEAGKLWLRNGDVIEVPEKP